MDGKEDPPKKPSTTGFKGKKRKGRRLSLGKKSTSRRSQEVQQDNAPPPPNAAADINANDHSDISDGEVAVPIAHSSIRPVLESRGAKRKLTMAELEGELKWAYAKIDESDSLIQAKDSTISSLSKRNKVLTTQFSNASDAVRASRVSARETKTNVTAFTKEAVSEVDKLSRMLEKSQADLAVARDQLGFKDAEIKELAIKHREALDTAIHQKVDEAKAKAEVC